MEPEGDRRWSACTRKLKRRRGLWSPRHQEDSPPTVISFCFVLFFSCANYKLKNEIVASKWHRLFTKAKIASPKSIWILESIRGNEAFIVRSFETFWEPGNAPTDYENYQPIEQMHTRAALRKSTQLPLNNALVMIYYSWPLKANVKYLK